MSNQLPNFIRLFESLEEIDAKPITGQANNIGLEIHELRTLDYVLTTMRNIESSSPKKAAEAKLNHDDIDKCENAYIKACDRREIAKIDLNLFIESYKKILPSLPKNHLSHETIRAQASKLLFIAEMKYYVFFFLTLVTASIFITFFWPNVPQMSFRLFTAGFINISTIIALPIGICRWFRSRRSEQLNSDMADLFNKLSLLLKCSPVVIIFLFALNGVFLYPIFNSTNLWFSSNENESALLDFYDNKLMDLNRDKKRLRVLNQRHEFKIKKGNTVKSVCIDVVPNMKKIETVIQFNGDNDSKPCDF